MSKYFKFCLLIFAFFLSSCGSGTFKDDPKTWNKVFGEGAPKEIQIINSQFWKSTHWSYEFDVFLELKYLKMP